MEAFIDLLLGNESFRNKVIRVTPETKKQLSFLLSLRRQFTNKDVSTFQCNEEHFFAKPTAKSFQDDFDHNQRNLNQRKLFSCYTIGGILEDTIP